MSASPSPTPRPLPRRLAFLTLPLMIALVYNGLSLLTIPFSGPMLNDLLVDYGKMTNQSVGPLSPEQIQMTLWISFFLTAALVLWLYFTRQAVLEGKASGRTSSIVIAVLSLLLFPFGTILGIAMLFGAFDREVAEYLRR
ncbi:hypothetical protein ACINK0_07460 [Deinococcus sp. VB343]|uniref:DUF4234 domain-containing protein n=1 Tax=Deinococcus sp. VB142 TaxID=3112952 RepID=A0AAU6Q540_9DEIO|nr:hypothetical protein [Deinococcus sp.]MDO4246708.1 hypothetical protein [Deinococcus sp.]